MVLETSSLNLLQCSFCGSDKDLQRCGRCFGVQYCSKEHQKLHWKTHKKACKATTANNNDQGCEAIEKLEERGSSNVIIAGCDEEQANGVSEEMIESASSLSSTKKIKRRNKSGTSSVATTSSASTESGRETDIDNTENCAPDSGPMVNVPGSETMVRGPPSHLPSPTLGSPNGAVAAYSTGKSPTPSISFVQRNFSSSPETRLLQICLQAIQDLNKHGVCVIDNLLGEKLGGEVLNEVISIHKSGAFQDGQVVREHMENGAARPNSVRGDKITWVEKKEPGCDHITSLIELVDTVIMPACRMKNNGKLGMYTIKDRTKAMIACYPGSGSKYVKHVDNPNNDGRCVTAIYYLNKDWNTKIDGGLLRIFPEGWPDRVADIEPLFDRLLFFWSDRRNPHEVQPAYRMRYAITMWYFDSKEKELARSRQSQPIQQLS